MGVPVAIHQRLRSEADRVIRRDLRAGVDLYDMDATLIAEEIDHVALQGCDEPAVDCADAAWSAASHVLREYFDRDFR
jgi:hypothetical protein